jgi:hypothetical protein
MNLRLLGGNELDLSGGQPRFVSGADEVRQAIQARLSLVQGEWFLDPTAGMDLFGHVLVKNPNLALVKREIRTIILATAHVTGIVSLDLSLDRASRQLSATFVATTDGNGVTVSGSIQMSLEAPTITSVR